MTGVKHDVILISRGRRSKMQRTMLKPSISFSTVAWWHLMACKELPQAIPIRYDCLVLYRPCPYIYISLPLDRSLYRPLWTRTTKYLGRRATLCDCSAMSTTLAVGLFFSLSHCANLSIAFWTVTDGSSPSYTRAHSQACNRACVRHCTGKTKLGREKSLTATREDKLSGTRMKHFGSNHLRSLQEESHTNIRNSTALGHAP